MNGKQRMAEQSRLWLWEALVRLLQQQSYQDITISAIANEAQLARRTFYRSFKSKDDLVDYYCRSAINRYLKKLKAIDTTDASFEIVLKTFFDFWWSEKAILRLLIKNNLFNRLLTTWTPQLSKIYARFQVPWHIHGSSTEISYIMTFSTGGFWNVLNHWLIKEHPERPEEVTQTLLKALNKLSQI
ncbi:TetR/AcrR family transcriptional regulator [Liquorilactobacillus uvarum]|uniref:Transcriptional regulator n=1 Tax=Liquorilactobacillus uvarum DSM 19971 TaxID=1423812 RepID=A0A0R1Q6U3_9LACO|nr:TetR/AcrR family transcriptional regulator [Liquorilactobacillus uvarum]KRL37027.1 transcriptional regulator [Liquorilactobacillus uvarum DSM 19971]